MRRLSPLDTAFLLAESRETPMHVGGLYLFTLPAGADERAFLAEILEVQRSPAEWRRPFGHRLSTGRLGPAGPTYWEPDERLDVDYHVRHSALPKPGRYRELFVLAARLHQTLLDRRRPLWETHVIEGVRDRQFALYSKLHHATIDGVGGVRLALQMLSPDPEARCERSPLSLEAYRRAKAARRPEPPSDGELKRLAEVMREQYGVGRGLLQSLRTYARAWLRHDEDEALTTAWRPAPATSFSAPISGARRFVAQSYPLPRVKAVAAALGGTVNDVVLAMCGGALRRYLGARGELPGEPLTAMTPVTLRTDRDVGSGNAVGALTANLATHLADPAARWETITASMNRGKALFSGMTAKEIALFSQLTQTPLLVAAMLGLGQRFPPFSTVISNVPGPRERRYLNGARLEGMYPMSAIFHGFALNITLLSNDDQLDFGLVACRETVPGCQRLIDDLQASLDELAALAGVD